MIRHVIRTVQNWVAGLLPESVHNNRGYLPGLLLWLITIGATVSGLCLVVGEGQLGQEVVNATTIAGGAVGIGCLLLEAWEEVSIRKTVLSGVWSVGAILIYFGSVTAALTLGYGLSEALGIRGANQFMLVFGGGGLVTIYVWIKGSVWLFRWLRTFEKREKMWGEAGWPSLKQKRKNHQNGSMMDSRAEREVAPENASDR